MGFDLGCPLVVDKIRKNLVEQEPRNLLLVAAPPAGLERRAKSLAALDVSLHLLSQVVAF